MKAMVLNRICSLKEQNNPLDAVEIPIPELEPDEILVKVSACGVCHTELDEIEGRTPPPRFPMIPGHQVVGAVTRTGGAVDRFKIGDRVGIAWIHWACGQCEACRRGEDNLCPEFRATGRDADGGYAEFTKVSQRFAFAIPERFTDTQAAPLLCAGAIGYRSLRLTGMTDGQRLGLTGFGASAHLVLKMARHRYPKSEIFVFARNPAERGFALELGAAWAGDIHHKPPRPLHAIIDTTPVWNPVVFALEALGAGGRLVINAIRKEDKDKETLLTVDYPRHLWMEKEVKSVANVASADVSEFLKLAAEIPIIPEVETYSLDQANEALVDLRKKRVRGGKVLVL